MSTKVSLLTQTIPQLFQLCDTIHEAAAHGAKEHTAAPGMKADITSGIAAVEAAARKLSDEDLPSPAKLDGLAALSGEQITTFVDTWFMDSIGPYLIKQFRKILIGEPQFFQEDAQKIAHCILNEIPVKPSAKREILLELAMRCTEWAPEFSWHLMNQVLDTMPPKSKKNYFLIGVGSLIVLDSIPRPN